MRALISVYDKAGVAEFARGLTELGFEVVASGGTAAHLEEHGIEVTRVESLTGFAELLGHRVVTLHPAVHGGILARRDVAEDLADLKEHGIEPIDLVCVNLYPFEREPSVELIDIGGPSLLRGAAKNYEHVAAVSQARQYEGVLDELRRDGALSEQTPKALELAYGENPDQRAAFYGSAAAVGRQRQGKPLSYNNLNDLSAGRALLDELGDAACVIVKHANPCGAAQAETIEEAYERALACDPVSAFGGIVVIDRLVGAALASRLVEQFLELLWAPAYSPEALSILEAKPNLRVLESLSLGSPELGIRSALGGLLVQEQDRPADHDSMDVVCGEVADAEWADLLFAWTVCKHVTSNAIVLAKDLRTIGIGAGQTSRVDAVRIAVDKAREHGHDLTGAALASDAFFPFADGPRLALAAGVRTIVQPGGSKRDAEVIEAARAAGAAMVFTGRRHFRH